MATRPVGLAASKAKKRKLETRASDLTQTRKSSDRPGTGKAGKDSLEDLEIERIGSALQDLLTIQEHAHHSLLDGDQAQADQWLRGTVNEAERLLIAARVRSMDRNISSPRLSIRA